LNRVKKKIPKISDKELISFSEALSEAGITLMGPFGALPKFFKAYNDTMMEIAYREKTEKISKIVKELQDITDEDIKNIKKIIGIEVNLVQFREFAENILIKNILKIKKELRAVKEISVEGRDYSKALIDWQLYKNGLIDRLPKETEEIISKRIRPKEDEFFRKILVNLEKYVQKFYEGKLKEAYEGLHDLIDIIEKKKKKLIIENKNSFDLLKDKLFEYLSLIYTQIGAMKFEEKEYRTAIEYLKKGSEYALFSSNFSLHIECLYEIGASEGMRGNHKKALKNFKDVLPLAEKYKKQSLPRVLFNIGVAKTFLKKHEEAIKEYDEAIDVAKKIDKFDTLASAHYNKGYALTKLGKHEEAIKEYDEAIDVAKKIDKFDTLASAYNGKGALFGNRGQHKEALRFFERGMKHAKKSGDSNIIIETWQNICLALKNLDMKNEFEKCKKDLNNFLSRLKR